jgi:hypothetical protein
MNKFTSIAVATIISGASLLPNAANAAAWTAVGPYGGYSNNWATGFTFTIAGVATPCGNQFYVDWSNPNSKQLYALILTAMVTGRQIAAYYSCGSVTGFSGPFTNNVDIR